MEEHFWNCIKRGDEQAFNSLYEQYADMLYGYGMKIIADEELVGNAIQSLFVYLYEKRKTISEPNSVSAYLCVSLKRLISLEVKKRRDSRNVSIEDVSYPDYDFELEIDIEKTMIAAECDKELLNSLQQALDTLTKRQREIVYLKYFKEMNNNEIATIMDLSIQTVKNTNTQALARLREFQKLANTYIVLSVFLLSLLLF